MLVGTGALTTTLASFVVLRSTNGGAGWEIARGLPNAVATSIRFSPAFEHDGTAFVGNAAGLYRSVDRGRSWARTDGSPAGVLGIAISPDFDRSRTLYVLTGDGRIHTSRDGGTSFSPLPSTPAGAVRLELSPQASTDHAILVGTNAGAIQRSTDGGKTWSESTTPGGAPISAFTFSPGYERDVTVFASSFGGGVWASTDGGATWKPCRAQPDDAMATAIVVSPDFPTDSTLFVTTADGVFTSTDAGTSWSKLPKTGRKSPQTTKHFTALAVGRIDPAHTLVLLGTFEGLWQKTREATRWTYDEIVPTRIVRSLQVSPAYTHDHTVAASTYGGGMLLSNDGGESWRYANTGLINPYPMPLRFSPEFDTDGTLFVGVWNGFLRSSDRGAHWTPFNVLGVPVFPRAIGVPPTFRVDKAIFVGTDNRGTSNPKSAPYDGHDVPTQGAFLSSDAGGSWTPRGLPDLPILAIEVSPNYASDGTLCAGATEGLYVSHARGESWTRVPGIADSVIAIAVSPQFATDHTVFACAPAGVLESIDGGTTWTTLTAKGSDSAVGIALSTTFATDHTIFLATLSNGLLASHDGGKSFGELSLPETYISAVTVSPGLATDHTVFAAGYQGIYRSTDGGATWRYLAVPERIEEDRAGNVIYEGSWKVQTDPEASSTGYTSTTQATATVVIEFTGTGATWLGPKGPKMTAADVVLDQLASERVTLSAPESHAQQVIWSHQNLPCDRHTLRITAAAAEGKTGIGLDALDVTRDATCGGGQASVTAARRSLAGTFPGAPDRAR